MLITKCYNHLEFNKWLEKLKLVDLPIREANAHVSSDHFTETCYVSSVLECVALETACVATTRDIGIQCGKFTKKYTTMITDVEL